MRQARRHDNGQLRHDFSTGNGNGVINDDAGHIYTGHGGQGVEFHRMVDFVDQVPAMRVF